MTRVTLAMCGLGTLLAIVGLGIIWLGLVAAEWPAVAIGICWVAFAGLGAAYAWKIRHEA